MKLTVDIVIPARLASTRLPRKLLLDQTGKTLLEHTYRAARSCRGVQRVIVAADCKEIADAVAAFGGEAMLTRPDHVSGTDRVAEVAAQLTSDFVVNVQGDEPEIDPGALEKLVRMMQTMPTIPVATLATPIRNRNVLEDPACVKVVMDHQGRALYFSRSPIPCARTWDDQLLWQQPPVFWQHVGVYGFRRDFLLGMPRMSPSQLERVESLEQLRVLQHGLAIQVVEIEHAAAGIDTPEDYQAFVRRQQK